MWPFRRSRGRHALGAAVTGIPSGPLAPARVAPPVETYAAKAPATAAVFVPPTPPAEEVRPAVAAPPPAVPPVRAKPVEVPTTVPAAPTPAAVVPSAVVPVHVVPAAAAPPDPRPKTVAAPAVHDAWSGPPEDLRPARLSRPAEDRAAAGRVPRPALDRRLNRDASRPEALRSGHAIVPAGVLGLPAPAAVPAPVPAARLRVELGFTDGSTAALDPASEQARALEDLASVLRSTA